MLTITEYGPGCKKCQETERRVRDVVEQSGIEASIQHTTDFAEIAKAGNLATPAVAVNGAIKLSGRVPNEDEIRTWLQQ